TPVERVFSSSKNLITDKRSNLNPKTIRACMGLKGCKVEPNQHTRDPVEQSKLTMKKKDQKVQVTRQ
ncbi:10097_t:CDS:2, partial [Racocetra fulgida]